MKSVALGLIGVAILHSAAAAQRGALTEKMYDVRDLIVQPTSKAQATSAVRPGRAKGKGAVKPMVPNAVPPPELSFEKGVVQIVGAKPTMGALQRWLAESLKPGLRDRDEVDGFRNGLRVVTDAARHQGIQRILAANRDRAKATKLKVRVAELDAKQCEVVRRFLGGEGPTVLSIGRRPAWAAVAKGIEFRDGPDHALDQVVSLRLDRGDRTRYVKDYELKVETASFKVLPVFGWVDHGFDIALDLGWMSAARLSVRAHCRSAEIVRPVKVVRMGDLRITGLEKLKIQLPRTVVARQTRTYEMGAAELSVMLFPLKRKRGLLVSIEVGPAAVRPPRPNVRKTGGSKDK